MYKQGDILLVPIPYSDMTSMKKRPVLVLSNDLYNKQTEDIIVAAIQLHVKLHVAFFEETVRPLMRIKVLV